MIIRETFEENRLKLVEKWKIISIWWMFSIGQGKLRNLLARFCAFRPKMKKILNNLEKILRFFDQNSDGKLIFFTIFYLIFLGILHPLWAYISPEDNTRFLQQFFRFRCANVIYCLLKLLLAVLRLFLFQIVSVHTYTCRGVFLHTQRCFV